VLAGGIDPNAIDEAVVERRLYTADMPDPDLLIRTAGEQRISNFLLWQLSYAEICFSEKCWPEFEEPDLHDALAWFATRDRSASLLGDPMQVPTSTTLDSRLIGGSLLFGIGWGLVGLCPGPALVVASLGNAKALGFVAAMATGMALFEWQERR